MTELITFGEGMIRLSTSGFQRIEQGSCLNLNVGGSELNVAVVAARLGLTTKYVTRLTRNALGRLIEDRVREHGVDTSEIIWTDSARVGAYFLEFGAAPRANSVIYDRENSAIALIQPNEVDWAPILEGAKLFHTSGITPALSASAAETTRAAIRSAQDLGIKVSLDLNYRARLWSREQARNVMEELTSTVNILITTEEDTKLVFGIEAESYEAVAQALADRFDLEVVAITLRDTPSVWRNRWTAIAFAGGEIHHTHTYEIEVVDRVGSGDSFAGGFLYGLLRKDVAAALEYGVAVSALKQTSPGDLCWATLDEVERLLGSRSLRIVR